MMSNEVKTPKKGGRPSKSGGEGKSPTITFRCRPPLLARVHASAQSAHRSISEEVERRLEDSYRSETTLEDQTSSLIYAARSVVFDILYDRVNGKENFDAGQQFAHALKSFQSDADAKFRSDEAWYHDIDKRRYVTDKILDITKDIVDMLVRNLDPGSEERRHKASQDAANAGLGALGSLGAGFYDRPASGGGTLRDPQTESEGGAKK